MSTEAHRNAGRLHRDSSVPLYVQIAEAIRRDIADGRLGSRTRLPSENALMARFGVSRITVRAAIARLAKAGLVEAHQGKGTFVAGRTVRHGLDRLTGFYDEMVSQGLRPRRQLVDFRPALPAELEGTPYNGRTPPPMVLKRLYEVDGNPFAVVAGLLLPEADRLPAKAAAAHTIHELVAMLQFDVARADIAIRVRNPGPEVARLLGVSPRRQVLQMQRTSYGPRNLLIEHTLFSICAEAYEFRLSVPGPVGIGSGIRRADNTPAATSCD